MKKVICSSVLVTSLLLLGCGNTSKTETKLSDHIKFMVQKLQEGKTPRAFDTLFIMEAYMKVNHQYTTSVEQSGSNVIVRKQATTPCAYDVIVAHSNTVSGDFFAQGDIDNDYSVIAEGILNSQGCANQKSEIEQYIQKHKKKRE